MGSSHKRAALVTVLLATGGLAVASIALGAGTAAADPGGLIGGGGGISDIIGGLGGGGGGLLSDGNLGQLSAIPDIIDAVRDDPQIINDVLADPQSFMGLLGN